MGIVWTNPQELDLTFRMAQEEYDMKSIKFLQSVGERAVKLARINGNYTDQTANLRNSIGYIIVQANRVVYESFVGDNAPRHDPQGKADAAQARAFGLNYAKEVGATLRGNKTFLVLVAGMEYARHVEAKGYDVIQGSENWVKANTQKLMDEFSRYLKYKGL